MLISIIIPVYKNQHYLSFSLASVLNQTYTNLEIIIINDGEKDDSKILNIIKIQRKQIPIRYFKLKKNFGVAYALNYGIRKSKGELINWLSHDDYFHKDKLRQQINFMIKNKCMVCYTSFFLINDQKQKLYSSKIRFFSPEISILVRDNVNFCTLLINKKVFDNVGLFNDDLKHTQDYDMMYRIFSIYDPKYLNIPLFFSRIHHFQNSKLYKDVSANEKVNLLMSKKKVLIKVFNSSNLFHKLLILFFFSRRKLHSINHFLIESLDSYAYYFIFKLYLMLSKLINS